MQHYAALCVLELPDSTSLIVCDTSGDLAVEVLLMSPPGSNRLIIANILGSAVTRLGRNNVYV